MEKGTAVKDYASGEELIAEIRKRAELFIAEFDDVPRLRTPHAQGRGGPHAGADARLPAGVDGPAAGLGAR